ncbi:MAG: aminoglycoside 6-adenylyltransferase [Oscillospiraceae bacterium]|nr:aminoglycoside 6-adenylyltransferase [Oscillospiraceae bacterium]
MRTEQEMYELIIGTAKADDRIRAVYMNGSRTNPNVPRDIFQDYDIGYVVTETKPFYEDKNWIDIFGERLYMQCPDEVDKSVGMDVDFDKSYGWLIQFADGNRLDLHVEPIEFCNVTEDKLCKILLDKDGILPPVPESTDIDYHIKKPDAAHFHAVCNEFWWCMNNVAKGLWRDEIPYVLDMLSQWVRTQLINILSWKIGFDTDFSVSVGKSAKYMYKWLEPSVWQRFLETYGGITAEEIWRSVFIMCDLFDEFAPEVAGKIGCEYNTEEAANSRLWLETVKCQPKNAKEIIFQTE